ncbi:MAG TPA: protein kinase [Chloroflexota bacterium]|nr:protein kinase [Chloroflexota bacterium]
MLAQRYRLGRQIGSGGMATVYEGEDTHLSRRVAIKVMHPQYVADDAFVTRFRREALAVAQLKHPGIVDVYDVDHDDARYFIVMEFVEGQSIKELVRDGPLTPERTVDIGIQVGKALESAHLAGVVHRDVKSHNILVSPEGAAKLVDFGIAVAKGAASVTEAGTILGTVQYISPEQARGEPATPSSDIYSLGIVLYEMATGRLPFDGDNPVQIATRHVSDPPIAPAAADPRVPAGLSAAIMHALAKRPEDRPATAGALVRELLLSTDDVCDQPTRVVQPISRPAARPEAPPPRIERGLPSPRPALPATTPRRSSAWPILALAFFALALVLGLIPLWSAVLRGA